MPAFDELKGRSPEMYVSIHAGRDPDEVATQVKAAITQLIGPIARPKYVWIAPDLPKTRSGKIMRRVTAAISNFVDVGDGYHPGQS